MDAVEAQAQIEAMTAWDSVPALTVAEVSELVTLAQRPDVSGTPANINAWQASQRYVLGQLVVPTTANGHRYKVTDDGLSDSTEPDWPTGEGVTVTDGTVIWTEVGSDTWVPTWDLNYAAAEGWRRKAAKVAGSYDFSSGGDAFSRSQMVEACLSMAKMYAGRGAFTVRPD